MDALNIIRLSTCICSITAGPKQTAWFENYIITHKVSINWLHYTYAKNSCSLFCVVLFEFSLVISPFHLRTQLFDPWYKWDKLIKLKRSGVNIRPVVVICFSHSVKVTGAPEKPCHLLCSPVSSSGFCFMQRHWLESDCCVSDWCPALRLQQCITPHYPVPQRSHTLTQPSASDTLSWAGKGPKQWHSWQYSWSFTVVLFWHLWAVKTHRRYLLVSCEMLLIHMFWYAAQQWNGSSFI